MSPGTEGPPPHLEGPGTTLARAAPCARRPFGLATPEAEVTGTEMDGVEQIRLDGRVVLEGLRTGAGGCSNVLAAPRQLRRELLGPGGSVLETALVTERPGGAAVQWTAGADGALALDLAWRHPPGGTAWKAEGGALGVEGADGRTRVALVPPPERWEVEPGPDGLAVRARVRSETGDVTLLCVASEDGDLDERLRRVARFELHERRAETELLAARGESLAFHTGLREVDEGMEWAKARLRSVPPTPVPDPLHELWIVHGLLSAGEGRAAVARLAARPRSVTDLIALGEAVRWTGDAALARTRLAAVDAMVGGSADPAGDAERRLLRAALEAAADAAEAAGDRGRAERWRARAGTHAAAPADSGTGVRLPVVGAPDGSGTGTSGALAALLGAVLLPDAPLRGEPGSPPEDAVERALRAWALYRSGDADAAYLHLRTLLESQERDAFVAPPAAAALLPTVVLRGMLGARAEAAWGRLRLAPVFPSNWTRAGVTGIRAGEAVLALRWEREGAIHTFTLVPEGGRVPATVVFEPRVPGRIGSVRVDGAPADVDVREESGRGNARLQLPVDRPRTVTLTTDA